MQYDLSVIICFSSNSKPLRPQIEELIDILNEHGISHEIIVTADHTVGPQWEDLRSLCEEYKAIKVFQGKFTNGINGMAVCGCMHSNGKFICTLDPNLEYPPRSIVTLWHAIVKSNCDVIYGRAAFEDEEYIGKLTDKTRRFFFSLLSGMSSETSFYRIINAKSCEKLKAKTPYFFLFDQLIKPIHIHNHFYFKINEKTQRVMSTGFSNLLLKTSIRPLAWSYLAEVILFLLIGLNIYLLTNGSLISALTTGISSLLFIWLLYLIKFRRRISFRIQRRIPA